MIHRQINIRKNHSFFLFGARGTGKTTLLESLFPPEQSLRIDLLNTSERQNLEDDPDSLERRVGLLSPEQKWVTIDEVQKIPSLLDLVHRIIEKTKIKFALTGSSARRLKTGGANLLAGRAFVYELYPFTSVELGSSFDLDFALQWGTLPGIYQFQSDEERSLFLESYASTYLKEEIWEEHLVKKLVPFRHFMQVAAQSSNTILNYSKIADDVRVDTKTVQQYFQILEDTLLGFMLEPYHESIRKRQRANPKFYFFDTGVIRALKKIHNNKLLKHTYEYGKAFEQFVISEIHRLNSYKRKNYGFYYIHSADNAEVDLIIERPACPLALVEIKSTNRVLDRDLAHLRNFAKDFPKAKLYCLSQDKNPQRFGSIEALPWQRGIEEIGLN